MKKIIALVLAVILVFSFSVIGLAEEKSSPVVLKIGEHEFTLEDMNYMYVSTFMGMYDYYYNLYASYGVDIAQILDVTRPLSEQVIDENLSWHQYVLDYTVDSLITITGIYDQAMATGFVLPEDYQTDIDTLEEQTAELAAAENMTIDEYISANYGKGTSFEAVAKMTELQLVCNAYIVDYNANIVVSEEDIAAYYEANKTALDTINFRFFTIYFSEDGAEGTVTEEVAKAQAENLAAVHTAEEFNALAYEYADESKKADYEAGSDITLYPGATYASVGVTAISDWLYDEARVYGDTFVYYDEAYSCYIAVLFEERLFPDYDMINIRHILISPEQSEEITTEEAWANAEAKATEVYNEYLAGEMTEEAFGALATAYSSDGSAYYGGLIENVTKGRMVAEFNDWCFAEGRQVGDTDIVKTVYGYHIMYFSGYAENYLVSTVEPVIAEEMTNAWIEECGMSLDVEKLEGLNDVSDSIYEIVASFSEGETTETEATEQTEPKKGLDTNVIIAALVAVIVVCVCIIIKNAKAMKKPKTEEPAAETAEETTEEAAEEVTEEESAEEIAEESSEEATEEVSE